MPQLHTENLIHSGRPPGAPNKLKRESLLKRCEDAGYQPEEAMIEIAKGELQCLTCFGDGETLYAKVDPETGARIRDSEGIAVWERRKCESCGGTCRERMHVADVLKARTSIFDKIVPSLKQVDHSNEDGSLRQSWVVTLAPEVKPVAADMSAHEATVVNLSAIEMPESIGLAYDAHVLGVSLPLHEADEIGDVVEITEVK